MKGPWSQFSSLRQSHNGLILEFGLVFVPWMLSPILCGATGVSALRPLAPSRENSPSLPRSFQMLTMPRPRPSCQVDPEVGEALSLSLLSLPGVFLLRSKDEDPWFSTKMAQQRSHLVAERRSGEGTAPCLPSSELCPQVTGENSFNYQAFTSEFTRGDPTPRGQKVQLPPH